jgi:predicted nucleotidyltransferase
LAPLTTRIQCAFIFGSVARGAETEGSDIDVLVIGEVGFGEIVEALYPPQSAVGREINPMVFSVEEWRVWLREKKDFVAGVLGKPKIHLVGGEGEFEELCRHQS